MRRYTLLILLSTIMVIKSSAQHSTKLDMRVLYGMDQKLQLEEEQLFIANKGQDIDTFVLTIIDYLPSSVRQPHRKEELYNQLYQAIESYTGIGHLEVYYNYPTSFNVLENDAVFFEILKRLPIAQTAEIYLYGGTYKKVENYTYDTLYKQALLEKEFYFNVEKKAVIKHYPHIYEKLSWNKKSGIFFPRVDTLIIESTAKNTFEKIYLHPSFGYNLDHLKVLELHNYSVTDTGLMEIPIGIGQLQKLKRLVYKTYSSQQPALELPESFRQVQQLEELVMDGNGFLFPKGYTGLNKLRKIVMIGAKKTIDPILFSSKALEHIALISCELKTSLPIIKHLKKLKYLELDGVLQLPKGITNSPSLRVLKATRYGQGYLKLPRSFGQLQYLDTLSLNNIKKLPKDIGALKQLKWFQLDRYKAATLPQSIGQLQALQYLELTCVKLKELPSSFYQLPALTHLKIQGCIKKSFEKELEGMKVLKIKQLQINNNI